MTVRIRPAFPNNPQFNSETVSPQGGASNASGRIHGNAVFVEDDDYVVGQDDRLISLSSTDGASHSIDFTGVEGRVDGQIVDVGVVNRSGAGFFLITGVSTPQTLTGVGSTTRLMWSEVTSSWIVLLGATGAGDTDAALAIIGLNAALVGSSATRVGRFDGSTANLGALPLADWVERNSDEAAEGTELKITLQGVYAVLGMVATFGAGTVESAVTLDSATQISPSGARVLAHMRRTLSGGTDRMDVTSTGIARVTSAMAADPDLGIVRLNFSNGSGGLPANPPLDPTNVSIRIFRIGDGD